MLTLAIDQSTSTGSLALLRDGAAIAETSWTDERLHNQRLFARLAEWLRDASVSPAELDLFAVGLGPGSYSGLRISLAAAQGLALPGGKPVRGARSSDAVAREACRRRPSCRQVAVLGDARRDRLWLARYAVVNGLPVAEGGHVLVAVSDLPSSLPNEALVVTPDWVRIGATLDRLVVDSERLIREPCPPRALTIGIIAAAAAAAGEPPLPLAPIYLHPPVFVEPRYGVPAGQALPFAHK